MSQFKDLQTDCKIYMERQKNRIVKKYWMKRKRLENWHEPDLSNVILTKEHTNSLDEQNIEPRKLSKHI